MTYEALSNLIRTKFKTDVATPLNLNVVYDNQETDKTQYPETMWVRMSIRFGEARQITIGPTPFFRITGIISVQIFNVLGRGTKAIDEVVDAINASFRATTEDKVIYKTPSKEPGGRQETWWMDTVSIPFTADHNGA